MKNRIGLILLMAAGALVGNEDNGISECHDSPHIIDLMNRWDICENKWDSFKEELSWYVVYSNPTDLLEPSEDPEVIEGQQYLKEKWARNQELLTRSLEKTMEAFWCFRQCVHDAVYDSIDGTYANVASGSASIEVTYWFIEFMQNTLFPKNWKELYEKDKLKKTRSTEGAGPIDEL